MDMIRKRTPSEIAALIAIAVAVVAAIVWFVFLTPVGRLVMPG